MKEPEAANQWRSSIQEGLGEARIDQSEGRDSIAQLYEHILLDDVLPFWFPSCVDEASGAFFPASIKAARFTKRTSQYGRKAV